VAGSPGPKGNFLRLSRLTLAVILLHVWLIAFGSRVIENGQRALADRPGLRDLASFVSPST
jgi:hypothetical protein